MADEIPFTQADLEAFLDEGLSPEEMAAIETVLRDSPKLSRRLQAIHARRDAGVHSLGEIWRRHRITCPDRETLGNFLLGVLPEEQQAFIVFHLEHVGCRYCQANRDDLLSRTAARTNEVTQRHRRYFQSSAGLLRTRS